MPYKNRQDALNYSIERTKLYKKLKLCVYCGNKDAYTLGGRSACFDCAEKYAKQKHDKHYANKETIEKRKADRKALRERHIQNHECTVCGKKLPTAYKYKTCKSCRAYNRIRQRTTDTFSRGEFGICWTCNKQPSIQGKKLCQECYDRQLNILSKIPINKNHKWRKIIYGKYAN